MIHCPIGHLKSLARPTWNRLKPHNRPTFLMYYDIVPIVVLVRSLRGLFVNGTYLDKRRRD